MRSRRRQAPLAVAGFVVVGLVATPLGAAGADPGVVVQPQTVVTAGYVDTCHDAGGSPLDLREVAFTDDTSKEVPHFELRLTSCTPWTAADLGPNGFVEIAMAVAGTATDHRVSVTRDGQGELQLKVERISSGDAGTWTTTHVGGMERTDDDYTAVGLFEQSAVDDPEVEGEPSDFFFTVRSVDADKHEDLLPELYADVLEYPFSCSLQVQRAATVVAEPAAAEAVEQIAKARGARVDRPGRRLGQLKRAPAPAVLTLDDVSDATLEELRRAPGVQSAERAKVYRRSAVPDDPAYPFQWSLPAIGAERAWDVRSGSGLVLAVIDDGVDGLRPDLAEKILPGGRDTVWETEDTGPIELPADSDLGGHGTSVTGLAAAQTNNGFGVAGLDWDAGVLPFRVFDAAGCSTDKSVISALYAASDAGASVANLSLGGPGDSPALEQAVQEVTARGMLVVAASGNSRQIDDQPNYPAAYPEVLAVGATKRDGEIAAYSSAGDYVDITAPGGDGSGTAEGDLIVLGDRGGLAAQAGTSFAAPLVAAAALLFRAENPGLSPGQVIEAIERSAVDAGPTGRDPDYGAGRLDVRALLGTPTVTARTTEQACPEGYPRDRFADVPPESTHAANVDCVAWWQVSAGSGSGYDPLASVTRAQMATFLARVIERSGGDLPDDPPDAFLDDEESVHELRINQLANLGIVSGRGEGLYAPGEPVNRGQMATFLVRGFEFRSGSSLGPAPDYFADDDGTTHEPRINQAAAAGFTGGLSDGGYGPRLDVRRDGMATFLARVLDRLVADGRTTPPGV